MKSIGCWNDLQCFGIVPLTGEACGLSYRLLVDLTRQGKTILEKALGVNALVLYENWNQGSTDAPHIGCAMLAPELLIPIGVFALLENGCTEVYRVQGGLIGIESSYDPDRLEAFHRFHGEALERRFAYGGTAADRNRHVFTGRVH